MDGGVINAWIAIFRRNLAILAEGVSAKALFMLSIATTKNRKNRYFTGLS